MIRKEANSRTAPRRGTARAALLVTVLLPLFFVTGCAKFNAVKPAEKKVPDSLLVCTPPQPMPNPDTATQADADAALTDTYLAWEATCDNLKQVDTLLNKKDPAEAGSVIEAK